MLHDGLAVRHAPDRPVQLERGVLGLRSEGEAAAAARAQAVRSPLRTLIGLVADDVEADTMRLARVTPPRELAREEGQVVHVDNDVSRHCGTPSAGSWVRAAAGVIGQKSKVGRNAIRMHSKVKVRVLKDSQRHGTRMRSLWPGLTCYMHMHMHMYVGLCLLPPRPAINQFNQRQAEGGVPPDGRSSFRLRWHGGQERSASRPVRVAGR